MGASPPAGDVPDSVLPPQASAPENETPSIDPPPPEDDGGPPIPVKYVPPSLGVIPGSEALGEPHPALSHETRGPWKVWNMSHYSVVARVREMDNGGDTLRLRAVIAAMLVTRPQEVSRPVLVVRSLHPIASAEWMADWNDLPRSIRSAATSR